MAILRASKFHYVLMPTAKMTGIESIRPLTSPVPNYLDVAWAVAQSFTDDNGRPLARAFLGLAINSPQARTQDQLHVHIGCLRNVALRDLARIEAETAAGSWTPPVAVGGSKYRVQRLYGSGLGSADPILLASATLVGGQPLRNQTLVIAATTFKGGRSGFYVLVGESTADVPASGEDLLDYKCAAAILPRPPLQDTR